MSGAKQFTMDDMQDHYQAMGLDYVIGSFYETIEYASAEGPWVITDERKTVPIRGRVKFVADHDSFWGAGKDYESEIVTDPTWDDIMRLADDMIKTTGDAHHVFLEDVNVVREEDGVKIAEFIMGS